MWASNKKLMLQDRAGLLKRIDYQLSNHFFALEQLQQLSLRRVKKVIRKICKIKELKLSRYEIKNVAQYLISNLETPTEAVNKLWTFTRSFLKEKLVVIKAKYLKIIFYFFQIKSYREGKFELMLN